MLIQVNADYGLRRIFSHEHSSPLEELLNSFIERVVKATEHVGLESAMSQ